MDVAVRRGHRLEVRLLQVVEAVQAKGLAAAEMVVALHSESQAEAKEGLAAAAAVVQAVVMLSSRRDMEDGEEMGSCMYMR